MMSKPSTRAASLIGPVVGARAVARGGTEVSAEVLATQRSTLSSTSPRVSAVRACPFDLAARAELALGACASLLDPDLDGLPYSYVELHTDPPVAMHSPWDYADSAGSMLEAMTLARVMTGTPSGEADGKLATLLRSVQRDDGLIAIPAAPWGHPVPTVELDWSPRAALLAWVTRFLVLENVEAGQRAVRLAHALSKVAVWEGDACWFPSSYLPPEGWADRAAPIGKMQGLLVGGQIVFPLCRLAAAESDEVALRLAGGLIKFLRERSGAFERNGRYTAHAGRYLHSITAFIQGVLKHGALTGDTGEIDWAEAAYHYCQERGTEFGLFPHDAHSETACQGDVCACSDMIQIALLLARHKDPRYFADAERYGRNHLLESQVLDLGWVTTRADAPFCQDVWCRAHPPAGVTTEAVAERAVGTFAAWTRPNDAFDPANPRLCMRSTAAGLRALYCLWHDAVTRPEGAVMVNLHLSRDTRWASVTSLLSEEGGVEVLMKTRGVLAVRVPAGATDDQIEVFVNEVRPRHEVIRGDYAWLEALQSGDVVTVKWPVPERAVIYELDCARYSGYWRADTLLRMSPVGPLSPLYWRPLEMPPAHPRGADGPVREVDPL